MNANRPMTELLPPRFFAHPDCAKRDSASPDIVRRFLAWAQSADADARAQGASALARAYLYSELTAPLRAEAALAMTALLDDPSALGSPRAGGRALPFEPGAASIDPGAGGGRAGRRGVRASALARADRRRPRRMRGDRRRRRPDRAGAPAQPAAQAAIAALAEIGEPDAVLALIGNAEIDIPAETLSRIFARFSDDASVREALLERPSLPASLRARIVVALAKDLAVEASRWMPHERAERIASRGARSDDLSDRLVMQSRPSERSSRARCAHRAR